MAHTKWKQKFYAEVEPIAMIDPLASTLGAVEDHTPIYYSYTDCVKLAGHACPSVSSAFQITKLALKELFGDQPAIRGSLEVRFAGNRSIGANGPIGQVIGFITGAAIETGFHGFGGKFARENLFIYDENLANQAGITAEFKRTDTGDKVLVTTNPLKIPITKEEESYSALMPQVVHGSATDDEREKFYLFWQGKNRKILLEDHPGAFVIERI